MSNDIPTPLTDAFEQKLDRCYPSGFDREAGEFLSWDKFARTLERDLTAARQRIEGLEGDLRKETRRADAWVTAARDLSRELGVADEDSNGSIHDWRHIRSVLTMRESRLAAVEADAEQVRLATIEECAKLAEEHETHPDDDIICNGYNCAWMITTAIRHLKEKS